jgi:hypothetical protein
MSKGSNCRGCGEPGCDGWASNLSNPPLDKVVASLASLLCLAMVADAFTTYYCLAYPNSPLEVWEGNPIARWLFSNMGLVPGLILDTVVGCALVVWVSRLDFYGRGVKVGIFLFGIVCAVGAVINNLYVASLLHQG